MTTLFSYEEHKKNPDNTFSEQEKTRLQELLKSMLDPNKYQKTEFQKFMEYLEQNPNERIQLQGCKTAGDVREMHRILTARGNVQSSKGFSFLINALIDEGNLAPVGAREDQEKTAGSVYAPPKPRPPGMEDS